MPRADLGCYVLANSGMVHVFKMIDTSRSLLRSRFCEGIFIVSITGKHNSLSSMSRNKKNTIQWIKSQETGKEG